MTFRLQVREELVLPGEDEFARFVGENDLATVGDAAIGDHGAPVASGRPVGFLPCFAPVAPGELWLRERVPELSGVVAMWMT